MKREGKLEGKQLEKENGIKVLVESYTEDGIADDVIVSKLVRKYDLTEKEAKEKKLKKKSCIRIKICVT